MARATIALVLLGALLCMSASASPTNFILASCRTTRYPSLCVHSLEAYGPTVRRSPRQLAHAALSVSADRARSASTFVSKMSAGRRWARDGGAVRDCLETLGDSIDRLQDSVRELTRMGRFMSERYQWHVSNAQTWASAALTDENTCLDSLKQDPAAAAGVPAIRSKILDVARVTSNALDLVNRLGPSN